MRHMLALCLVLAAVPSFAELERSAADGFIVSHVFELKVARQAAYQALGHPELWWPSDHTLSGKAGNLSLDLRAGGCFCEEWDGGSVQHGTVLATMPGNMLRLSAALGPLQALAVTAVLTVQLEALDEGRTRATVTYRVSGDSSHSLSTIAPAVDRVIGEQFGRFARYASTGRSE